ncbi:MAG: serine/threonine-protein kinase, partial [Bryobacteraceae bacterium]
MKTCPTCSASYGNDVGACPHDGSTLRSSPGLEPGTVIRKKYEILSEIGRGGMGVVYRARHLIWNEDKALKVLLTAGSEGRPGLQALLAEALVMRQLQHPHIVRVEDADYTEDDQAFVVMEYVAGQNLRQKLDRGGPLAPELALQVTAQACSALSAAHKKGIIHRDIKPQNLLLAKSADGSETLKIIDFGIAKVREAAGLGFTGMMTTTGLFVGTPGYASPEQARGMRGSDLDGRTDLYSLGLVLYEMLTGRLPFAADTPFALLVQRIQVPPMPMDRVRPGLSFSPDVSNLVMKALATDREDRYQSAEEMERAILAVLDSWRTGRERHARERSDTARRAAEAEQERQATTLAAERAERELQGREAVALTGQVEGEGADPPGPEHSKSATMVPGGRALSRRPRIGYIIAAAALTLVSIGFFVVRSLTERTARHVEEQKAGVERPSRAGMTKMNPKN